MRVKSCPIKLILTNTADDWEEKNDFEDDHNAVTADDTHTSFIEDKNIDHTAFGTINLIKDDEKIKSNFHDEAHMCNVEIKRRRGRPPKVKRGGCREIGSMKRLPQSISSSVIAKRPRLEIDETSEKVSKEGGEEVKKVEKMHSQARMSEKRKRQSTEGHHIEDQEEKPLISVTDKNDFINCIVVKKRRGRPPKATNEKPIATDKTNDVLFSSKKSNLINGIVKRRRGRPPKAINGKSKANGKKHLIFAPDKNVLSNNILKRLRRRPPKAIDRKPKASSTLYKKRGEKRLIFASDENDLSNNILERLRLRPPKAVDGKPKASSTLYKKRGKKCLISVSDANDLINCIVVKRRRGRPRKATIEKPKASDKSEDVLFPSENNNLIKGIVRRRRDRPPKAINEKSKASEKKRLISASNENDLSNNILRRLRRRPLKAVDRKLKASSTLYKKKGKKSLISVPDKNDILKRLRRRPPKAVNERLKSNVTIYAEGGKILFFFALDGNEIIKNFVKTDRGHHSKAKTGNTIRDEKGSFISTLTITFFNSVIFFGTLIAIQKPLKMKI
ncbi:hypothetical protein DICVIV_02638 [Dictyocaulus viviparus]|uniref:Uncharacterized protein n=1 Tax=Dictyocaulus viviparus TaxID=29172 RepID=A0A0D8Y9E3_DICVI|nr:hypothetical protein DICVIV_02638 [Dictyocaulus viviparus]